MEDRLVESKSRDSPSVSSTVPKFTFGLFDRPTALMPAVAMDCGSESDPSPPPLDTATNLSEFVEGFSRPNKIVGGVNPDASQIPAMSPAGLKDGERGGGVSPPVSVIPDSSPIESIGRRVGGIGGGVSPPPARSAAHSSMASDMGGTAGGVSTPPSRSVAKSPAVSIDWMDSSFLDEIRCGVRST